MKVDAMKPQNDYRKLHQEFDARAVVMNDAMQMFDFTKNNQINVFLCDTRDTFKGIHFMSEKENTKINAALFFSL